MTSFAWDTSGERLRRKRVASLVDKRTCPECIEGVIYVEEQYIAVFCWRCKGKGYLGEEEVVSESISYSSGKVPEPEPRLDDTRRLVEYARLWAKTVDSMPTKNWIRGYVLDGINYVEDLCDALEESQAKNERLRHAAIYMRRELWELSLANLMSLTDDQHTKDQIEAVEKAWIVLDQAIECGEPE